MPKLLINTQVVFRGRAGGYDGHAGFTDPTLVYVVTPLVIPYASGTLTYTLSPSSFPLPSVPTVVYVSLSDPALSSVAIINVETVPIAFWNPSNVQLGTVQAGPISQGFNLAPIRQVPTPAPDSATTAFTLATFLNKPANALVFLNGQKMSPTTYTLVGTSLVTAFTGGPAQTGDNLEVYGN